MLLFCFLVVSLLQIQQLNAVALRTIRAGDSIVLRLFLFVLQSQKETYQLHRKYSNRERRITSVNRKNNNNVINNS